MNVNLMHGDCLDRMKEIPDGSVDMVLADLPFGTTCNDWDSAIPFEPLKYPTVSGNWLIFDDINDIGINRCIAKQTSEIDRAFRDMKNNLIKADDAIKEFVKANEWDM